MSLLAQVESPAHRESCLPAFASPGEPSKSVPLLSREKPSSCRRHTWPRLCPSWKSLHSPHFSQNLPARLLPSRLRVCQHPTLRALCPRSYLPTPKALTVTRTAFFSSLSSSYTLLHASLTSPMNPIFIYHQGIVCTSIPLLL